MNFLPRSAVLAGVIAGIYSVIALILSFSILPYLEKMAQITHKTNFFVPALIILIFSYPALFVVNFIVNLLNINHFIAGGIALPVDVIIAGILTTIAVKIKRFLIS